MHILYSIIVILLSINVLFGLQRAITLTQTSVLASNNIPNNVISTYVADDIATASEDITEPGDQGILPPTISAASAVVLDPTSGFIFYEKHPKRRVPIASTTKIATALVALDQYQLDEVLLVDNLGFVGSGSSMNLRLGEKITVYSLLYGLLLNSGNDAAHVLAQNYPGGVKGFVAAMNQKAKELGLTNTNFDNPAGFDSFDHYSSASDLATIAIRAHSNETLAKIVATQAATVTSYDKKIVHNLKNLNKLLSSPHFLGIKTGYTVNAKENLVALVEKDGHRVLTVVLGSNDRFGETKALVDWTLTNFSWQQ